MENTVLFDYPIDMDNEALIISNAIKNEEIRNYFVRQVNWQSFRQKEYQTIAWAIIESVNDGMSVNLDSILLKSRSCPIRYLVTFDFLQQLVNNFQEVPLQNFRVHVEKLTSDNVKAGILEKTSSLYSVCTNPQTKLSDIEDRLNYLKTIVESGYSSSRLEFKGMEEIIPQYIEEKKLKKDKYTTGFSQLDALLTEGFAPKQITTISALSSMGKCEIFGTEIMMYDCSFKKIEDIKPGELLMGPDSKPRKVISTTRGFGDTYRIHQKRGEDYVVNKHHILSLQKAGAAIRTKKGAKKGSTISIGWKENGEIVNISIKDAIKQSGNFFNKYRGYKAILEFEEKEITLEPYYLGIWLGNGTNTNQHVTTPNKELKDYLQEYAKKLNMSYTEYERSNDCCCCRINQKQEQKSNYLLNELRRLNLLNNKHIPHNYLYNTKEIRMEVLAGIVDTDGYMTSGIHEISTKYEQLKDDILFLGRSLGYYCTAKYEKKTIKSLDFEGMYWRIRICGYNYLIPNKIEKKKAYKHNKKHIPVQTKIEIRYEGKNKYAGFELDDDGLYLHKDFTVTHNSTFALSSMKNLSNKKIVTAQFALEMNTFPLVHKLLAFNSRLPIKKIVADPDLLTPEERSFYDAELERLQRNKHIFFNDKPMQSIKNIREQIMLLQDHLKTEYMVVVIDMFGKIKEFQTSDNFARDYEKVINYVQPMTKELGIHLILVTQIRRDVANRKFNRPTMNDLKNAGALTEASDIVLGIHRPFYSPEVALKAKLLDNNHGSIYGAFEEEEEDTNAGLIQDDMNKNIAEVIILKQRMGENNTLVNFYFDPETTCFTPIQDEYQKNINLTKKDLIPDGD